VTGYICRLTNSTDGATEAESLQLVAVHFDLEWTAITGYFDFDVDLDPHVLCDAIAREPWSRKFFCSLRAYVFLHILLLQLSFLLY